MEGVGDHADAAYHSPWKEWWGADLQGTFRHPIDVRDTDLNKRIVYSPRIYGPDVYDMEVRLASTHLNNNQMHAHVF